MEDRTLRQRRLDRPEGVLRSGQRHVHQPRLTRCQIRAIGPQQITAIEQLGLGLLLGVRFMAQFPAGHVITDRVIARYPGITLFQPTDRLADFDLTLEPAAVDPPLEPLQIGQEPPLLLLANRPVLGRATRAGAEHDRFLAVRDRLDPDQRLLLERAARRGRAWHRLEALLVLEVIEPLIALRLPRGDYVMQLAIADLLEVLGVGQ